MPAFLRLERVNFESPFWCVFSDFSLFLREKLHSHEVLHLAILHVMSGFSKILCLYSTVQGCRCRVRKCLFVQFKNVCSIIHSSFLLLQPVHFLKFQD